MLGEIKVLKINEFLLNGFFMVLSNLLTYNYCACFVCYQKIKIDFNVKLIVTTSNY